MAVFFVSVEGEFPIQIHQGLYESSAAGLDQESVSLPATPEVASPDTSAFKTLGEGEAGSHLVNLNERRWCIVSACTLKAPSEMLEIDQTCRCGYIVGKGNLLLAVRLVQENKLCDFKGLLDTFYNLGVLTRARCLNDELPWHLAVAKRAHAGIQAAMSESYDT